MKKKRQAANNREVKNCPECGREMERGYIITQAVRWSKEKHTQWALGQELVVPWQITAIPNVEAFRCTDCKLVLFSYGATFGETPKSFLKKCVSCGKEIPLASEECPHCGAKQAE